MSSRHVMSGAQAPSRLTRVYEAVYGSVCGRHPNLLPWHFQYLAVRELYRDLQRVLPDMSGRVLDVGCGSKPYQIWATAASEFIGLDISKGTGVDIVVKENETWPIEEKSIDAVLCTQVFEHTADLQKLITEIHRVLKPGGILIASMPFIYNQHGAPHDYWRFSVNGVRRFLNRDFDIVNLQPQGAIGSACGVLFLNWVETALNASKPGRIVKGIFMPVWILFSLVVNGLAMVVDWLDRTPDFYHNMFAVAKKRCD